MHSSTDPSNPQANLGSTDNRHVTDASSKNTRATEAANGYPSRVVGPPPRVPSGIKRKIFILKMMIKFLKTNINFLICAAKPGRVVGTVVPYENCRNMKDNYDPRIAASSTLYRNGVLPPQTVSPNCFFRPQVVVNHEKHSGNSVQLHGHHIVGPGHAHGGVGPTPDIVNPNPYYTSQASVGQIAIDAKVFQAQSRQFGAVGAVSLAAHMNVASVQYG